MPWLKVQSGDTTGKVFTLDRDSMVLGRDASREIVLADNEFSYRHARIGLARGQWRTDHED